MIPAVLALALAAAAGAEPSAAVADEIKKYEAELVELKAEAEPLVQSLAEIRTSFTPEADLPAVKARYDDVTERLRAAVSRARDLEDRFTSFSKARVSLLVVEGMTAYMNPTARPSQDTLRVAGGTLLNEDLKDQIRSFRRKIEGDANEAQAHYLDWERSWHQRRNTHRVYSAVGALAAALLSLAVWMWRRKPELVTVGALPTGYPQGLPTTPPSGGFVSGPAQGALLSGPVASAGALSGPVPSAAPDTLGGNFRVDRELGRGGMGVVYEATDMALGRKVAIKRMRDEVSANRRELDMFLSEARLVAQLKHPNLVGIHHIFREAEVLYLVFEYVPGRPLSAVLEEVERLPFDEARRILRGVGAGLDYAHSNKVIHRDLKPSNVMLSDDGTVKVMDFGIAHQAKKTVARVTKADAWGTPPYMSPEQELGTVSRESDIYSLAVLFYEMVTGRLPFEGPNFLAQKREMAFAPPSRAAELPAGLDAVLRRGLEAEAPKRFHSAAELLSALDAV